MNIAAVVGARPNFVKIAAIIEEFSLYPEIHLRLIHTGQHFDHGMSGAFFEDLGIPAPEVNLGVRADSPVGQTAEIMQRLAQVLAVTRPDLVLVVGDVNSTLAGALVASKLGIPLAHVEAGLRSFDRTMPEEINRILTDAVSDYCFTTEPSANQNLAREGVPADRVHYVGNVMIDTLFRFRDRAARSTMLSALGLLPGQFVVLTLHRPSNVDDTGALARVLDALASIARECPVVFPVHPRTRERLRWTMASVEGWLAFRPIDPVPYVDFIQLMANAGCVLTDSGGIQEESTALGVPCLTLRATTERPVTVSQGTNRLVGVDAERIEAAWAEIRQGTWPTGRLPDLWDGKAAQRIARVLLAHKA
jgi:UDP-N-acetylglucosamine 2-epimerase (non-hydrolysing)